MRTLKKKVLTAIFAMSFLMLFLLAGTAEQDRLTIIQFVACSVINFAVMIYSGKKAGLLRW